MSFFKKQIAPPLEQVLQSDKMQKALESRKSAREVRGVAEKELKDRGVSARDARKILDDLQKENTRRTRGERGLSALQAGLKGGGTGNKNYRNLPVESRVHPSDHRRVLQREVQEAIRSGDRVRQQQLRAEAIKHGYIK